MTTLGQTALLGNLSENGEQALAAFAAVAVTIGFGTRLFNFLVDGVSSKVGHSVGRKRWVELGYRVRIALGFALLSGIIASLILFALKDTIDKKVLNLDSDVAFQAQGYWELRILSVPIILLNMACIGILQGFHRVSAGAALISIFSLLELFGSCIVIVLDVFPSIHRLEMFGVVTLACQFLQAICAILMIILLPPAEADKTYCIFWRKVQTVEELATEPLISESAGYEGEEDDDDEEEEEGQDHLLDFVRDGFAMLLRSLVMQASFFMALIAASRLGTASLAAHSIVSQLWTLISYLVDGLAAAGIVLGSRIAAQAHDPLLALDAKKRMQQLVFRVALSGLVFGIVAAAVFHCWQPYIINLFTDSEDCIEVLDAAWVVLVVSQPVNAVVFVYDGLMYASHSFIYIRNYMVAGFLFVFIPFLSWEVLRLKALWAVWMAKLMYNIWRAIGGAILIHFIFLKEFDS